MIRKSLLILFTLGVTGCASIYKGQNVEFIDPKNIAVVVHENPTKSNFVITKIDEKWRGLGVFARYELAPGEHSLTIEPMIYGKQGAAITRWFDAEPGKIYTIKLLIDDLNNKWNYLIVENNSNKFVQYAEQKNYNEKK